MQNQKHQYNDVVH